MYTVAYAKAAPRADRMIQCCEQSANFAFSIPDRLLRVILALVTLPGCDAVANRLLRD